MNSNRLEISRLIGSYKLTQILATACKMNLFDLLKDKACSLNELTRQTKANPRRLSRLLDALILINLIKKVGKAYKNDPAARYLCENDPLTLKHFAIMSGADWYWQPWSQLDQAVKSDRSAFREIHGTSAFLYMEKSKIAADQFHRAMSSNVRAVPTCIRRLINMKEVKNILDLGGGTGVLGIELARVFKDTEVSIGDLAHAKSFSLNRIKKSGIKKRIEFIEVDFFKPIRGRYDLIVLRHILHDWSDKKAIQLLSNCARALSKNGKIAVIERVKSKEDNLMTVLTDIEMMVEMEGGKERSKSDFLSLFKKTKLRVGAKQYFSPIDRTIFILTQ